MFRPIMSCVAAVSAFLIWYSWALKETSKNCPEGFTMVRTTCFSNKIITSAVYEPTFDASVNLCLGSTFTFLISIIVLIVHSHVRPIETRPEALEALRRQMPWIIDQIKITGKRFTIQAAISDDDVNRIEKEFDSVGFVRTFDWYEIYLRK